MPETSGSLISKWGRAAEPQAHHSLKGRSGSVQRAERSPGASHQQANDNADLTSHRRGPAGAWRCGGARAPAESRRAVGGGWVGSSSLCAPCILLVLITLAGQPWCEAPRAGRSRPRRSCRRQRAPAAPAAAPAACAALRSPARARSTSWVKPWETGATGAESTSKTEQLRQTSGQPGRPARSLGRVRTLCGRHRCRRRLRCHNRQRLLVVAAAGARISRTMVSLRAGQHPLAGLPQP